MSGNTTLIQSVRAIQHHHQGDLLGCMIETHSMRLTASPVNSANTTRGSNVIIIIVLKLESCLLHALKVSPLLSLLNSDSKRNGQGDGDTAAFHSFRKDNRTLCAVEVTARPYLRERMWFGPDLPSRWWESKLSQGGG